MASAYSDDLRRKFLEAYQRGDGSLAVLAGRFGVSVSWAERLMRSLRETGKVERPPGGKRGASEQVYPATARANQGMDPGPVGLHAGGVAATVVGGTGIGGEPLSPMDGAEGDGTVSEKKSLHAAEQDTPASQLRRSLWRQETHQIDPWKLIFLDGKWRNPRDDAALRPRPSRRACGGRHSLRPLANVDCAGSNPRFRMGGYYDH